MLELGKEFPKDYLENGVNLLYFGDKHYQYKKPANRMDDFSETEKKKVREIRRLAKEHNVRVIIQPGDFLDKPRLPDDFVQVILEEWGFSAFKKAREDYEAGKLTKEEFADAVLDYIPLVGTVGNHELFGGSLKTLPRTTLGFMSSIGFMNLVDKDKTFTVKTKGGRSVAISGLPYDLHLLKDPNNFILKEKKGDTDVFLIHEALYNTTLGPEVNWLPIDKVYKSTKAELTIAGHIHHGFGWIEKDGKIFGNPGALAQQSAAVTELDRDLYGSLIHIAEDGSIFVKDIKLDCPRSRDLFDLSTKESKTSAENQINAVKKVVEKIDPIKGSEVSGLIELIGKNEDVPKEVVELALKVTESVESKMRVTQPLNENQDYRIKQIRLKNFEAHLDTIINITDDGVPYVFIGESSNGKSSIARALYFALENEGNAVGFIRRAKDVKRCEVTLVRVDDLSVTRVVEVKKNKVGTRKTEKNGWIIKYPDGTETETNTSALEEIQRLFGFNYLYLDEGDKVSLNFRKQKEPDFFLGFKEKQRAKLVGSLYGAQYLLGAIKELESERRRLNSSASHFQNEVKELEGQVASLSSIEKASKIIEQIKKDYEDLEQLKVKFNSANELQKTLIDSNRLNSYLTKFITKTSPIVSSVSNEITSLVEKSNLLERLDYVNKRMNDEKNKLKKINHFLTSKPFVDNSKTIIEELEEKSLTLQKATLLKKEIKDLKSEITDANIVISKSETIKDAGESLKQLEKLIQTLESLEVKTKNYKKQKSSLNLINKIDSSIVPKLDHIYPRFNEVESLSIKLNRLMDLKESFEKTKNELYKNDLELKDNTENLELIRNSLSLEEEKQFVKIGDLKIFGISLNN